MGNASPAGFNFEAFFSLLLGQDFSTFYAPQDFELFKISFLIFVCI